MKTINATENFIKAGKIFHNANEEDYMILYVNKSLDRTLVMSPLGLYIGAWGIDPKTGNWCQGHYFMNDFEAAVNWVLGKDKKGGE